jgi:hypothetical protein
VAQRNTIAACALPVFGNRPVECMPNRKPGAFIPLFGCRTHNENVLNDYDNAESMSAWARAYNRSLGELINSAENSMNITQSHNTRIYSSNTSRLNSTNIERVVFCGKRCRRTVTSKIRLCYRRLSTMHPQFLYFIEAALSAISPSQVCNCCHGLRMFGP